MKHLKKFNEELKPSTYKRAGNTLKHKHPERAVKLLQYAEEKDNNLYSFWIRSETGKAFTLPLEFTFPNTDLWRLQVSLDGGDSFLSLADKNKIEEGLTYMVNRYRNGEGELKLRFNVPFTLSPRHSAELSKIISSYKLVQTGFENEALAYYISSNTLSLFNIDLYISEGIYPYDEDENKITLTDDQFHKEFEYSFSPHCHINPVTSHKFYFRSGQKTEKMRAFISNRKDALKFKRNVMPKLIEFYKPIIHELFSEHIQSSPEYFEKAMSKLEKLSVNDLYRSSI